MCYSQSVVERGGRGKSNNLLPRSITLFIYPRSLVVFLEEDLRQNTGFISPSQSLWMDIGQQFSTFSSHGIYNLLRFCSTPEEYICQSFKNRYNFDWFTINNNNNSSNYQHFFSQSDFLKNQALILLYKGFWYQELTNQTEPYYVTRPVKT